jgi:hypothetical protein
MRGHHREEISRSSACATAPLTVPHACPEHLRFVRSLSERRRRFPLLAVALAEVPVGVPAPFVPPRGSWRIPAAASVKGRCRQACDSHEALALGSTSVPLLERPPCKAFNCGRQSCDLPTSKQTVATGRSIRSQNFWLGRRSPMFSGDLFRNLARYRSPPAPKLCRSAASCAPHPHTPCSKPPRGAATTNKTSLGGDH